MSRIKPLTETEVDKMLGRTSYFGLLCLYAVKLSKEKQTAFSRIELAKTANITSDYFHGFLVACYALEIIDYNFKGEIITITYLEPLISSKIELFLQSQSKKIETWQKQISDIKKYFE
jgi:hypothetical protein